MSFQRSHSQSLSAASERLSTGCSWGDKTLTRELSTLRTFTGRYTLYLACWAGRPSSKKPVLCPGCRSSPPHASGYFRRPFCRTCWLWTCRPAFQRWSCGRVRWRRAADCDRAANMERIRTMKRHWSQIKDLLTVDISFQMNERLLVLLFWWDFTRLSSENGSLANQQPPATFVSRPDHFAVDCRQDQFERLLENSPSDRFRLNIGAFSQDPGLPPFITEFCKNNRSEFSSDAWRQTRPMNVTTADVAIVCQTLTAWRSLFRPPSTWPNCLGLNFRPLPIDPVWSDNNSWTNPIDRWTFLLHLLNLQNSIRQTFAWVEKNYIIILEAKKIIY